MRVSRSVAGDLDVVVPGKTSDNVVPFHIHGPEARASFLPSNVDMRSTPGLGILKQGDITTFYVGFRFVRLCYSRQAMGNIYPDYRATIDSKSGVAQRFTGQWVLGKGPQLDPPVTLDFDKALAAIGKVKTADPWDSLAAIAKKPGG